MGPGPLGATRGLTRFRIHGLLSQQANKPLYQSVGEGVDSPVCWTQSLQRIPFLKDSFKKGLLVGILCPKRCNLASVGIPLYVSTQCYFEILLDIPLNNSLETNPRCWIATRKVVFYSVGFRRKESEATVTKSNTSSPTNQGTGNWNWVWCSQNAGIDHVEVYHWLSRCFKASAPQH